MFTKEIDVSRAFWDLETIGVSNDTDNIEDIRIIEHFNKTITQVRGRYEICCPWKTSKYELPTNYSLAELRLKSQIKNLKNENLKKEYDDIIKQQLNDGIIEKADISKEYKQRDEVIIHYLPHHAVVNEKKVRVIYEGNAKSNRFSKTRNECLYRGPNLIVNLCGVLLRFRMNKIALIADIKKAYLQLQLNPQDRDVTQFLWVKEIHKDVTVDNIPEYRFCRVIWGIISAAFLLPYTIFYHLKKYNTTISKDISRNIYVDNWISGTKNAQDAIDYHYETKDIFNAAEMTIYVNGVPTMKIC